MANSRQMAMNAAALFGVELVTAEGVSRSLQEVGLRTPGGRGRGAAAMTGLDIFHVSLALAAGIGMREAPDFIRSVTTLPLALAEVDFGLGGLIEFSSYSETSALSAITWRLKSNPLRDLDISKGFGPVVAGWIEGQVDEATGWKENGTLVLKISNVGPSAHFHFHDGPVHVDMQFWAARDAGWTPPAWERQTVLRGAAFRQMAKTYEAEGGKRVPVEQ